MAKKNLAYNFKKAQISLDNNEIVEYEKDSVNTFILSDFLKQFEGDNVFVDFSIKMTTDLEPDEIDGEE
ncbi:YonK family protein [Bacillus sp. S13(2024)]|uniref:YonK family protein n=1 Tax=Bacillus sp. S13(2024) TaxID=3162885 RepID=UPI003D1CE0DC